MTDQQTPEQGAGVRDQGSGVRDQGSGARDDGVSVESPQGDTSKGGGRAGSASTATEKDGFQSVTSTLGKIIRVIFTPLVWILRPLVFRVVTEQGTPKVYFTSFSTLMYIWPIMVVGVVGSWLFDWGWVGAPMLGWIWVTVLLAVIISIGADIDRNKLLAVGAVMLILWLGGVLLDKEQNIPVLSWIYNHLAALDVQFDPGTAKALSVATLVVLVIVVIAAWFDGRYEITTREITHKRVFRTSDSLPRAAKRIKRDWRDISEVLLGLGAGDLIVLDSNKNIVMRISNVPFLWFFRQDVDHILEVLATTEVEEAAAIEEDDLA